MRGFSLRQSLKPPRNLENRGFLWYDDLSHYRKYCVGLKYPFISLCVSDLAQITTGRIIETALQEAEISYILFCCSRYYIIFTVVDKSGTMQYDPVKISQYLSWSEGIGAGDASWKG